MQLYTGTQLYFTTMQLSYTDIQMSSKCMLATICGHDKNVSDEV